MVSADNLNLDVLELIFAHLDQHDLFHLSLVSSSFFAAATPLLYRSVEYGLRQVLRPALRRTSAFDTISLHPALAGHIRRIRIALPLPSPEQIQSCRAVLALRAGTGLESFVCTPTEVMIFVDVLASLSSVRYLRANVQMLKEEEQPLLLQVRGLRSLTLEFAPWKLIEVLPKWAADTLGHSLENLTFYSCFGLTVDILRTTVTRLPNLTGLHISTCNGFDFLDVFRVIPHIPSLVTLSFSIWNLTRTQGNVHPFHLPNLKELVVDLPKLPNPFPLKSFLSTFTLFAAAPLTSLAICGGSHVIPELPLESYEFLVNQHAETLHRLVLVKVHLPVLAVRSICEECKRLEVLGVPVPSSADLPAFIQALSRSDTLHTLVHVPGSSSSKQFAHPIDRTNVTRIMTSTRTLRRVESENHIWLGSFTADLKFEVKSEKRRGSRFSGKWYMPPETL
ncbi:hypothetical protein BJ322DRAFT_255344 [Thelephora terrestris]|uniref:F-box domain-containing protein n=1 Tax=Thelephora terrestris TaxID=56493 RepID=A0A9P6H841_9AGAM|nr:hypothetical protein BJ322DRAFT_255344 [Thelephora terrestris]